MNFRNILHKEDKKMVHDFIDYTRLKRSKPLNVKLEVDVRRLATYLKINSEQTNVKLANAFTKALESGIII